MYYLNLERLLKRKSPRSFNQSLVASTMKFSFLIPILPVCFQDGHGRVLQRNHALENGKKGRMDRQESSGIGCKQYPQNVKRQQFHQLEDQPNDQIERN